VATAKSMQGKPVSPALQMCSAEVARNAAVMELVGHRAALRPHAITTASVMQAKTAVVPIAMESRMVAKPDLSVTGKPIVASNSFAEMEQSNPANTAMHQFRRRIAVPHGPVTPIVATLSSPVGMAERNSASSVK